ncbi:uncharacterized protein LOC143297437 [Babylonia areolata]|uniref:uncharacterized protein LOC143297437 n=1 Tax=Babylonia areolata TaxID=304850 RepID=UPI003FD3700C
MLDMKVFLFLAVLSGAARKSHGQGESLSDCNEAEAAQRKECFVTRGLSLAAMPSTLDPKHSLYPLLESTLTMMDPTVHCSDPQKYGEAARCAVNVTKSCLDADGSRNVVMNADDVITGMQVLCDKRQEVNIECFKHFYVMVEECTKYYYWRASNPSSSSDTRRILCAKDDLHYDCMEAVMTPMCGENTTRVFLEQLDKYTVRPACVTDLIPSRQRDRYFATLKSNEEEGDGGDCPRGAAPHPFSMNSPLGPSLFLLLLLLPLLLPGWLTGHGAV